MKPAKATHRKPRPALAKLVRLGDKLAGYRADYRANIHAIESEQPFMAELTIDDCTTVIELIEAVRTDRNILEKYWDKGSHAPLIKPVEKISAAMFAAWKIKAGAKPNDELFESVGEKFGLSLDQVKHAYREFVKPAHTKKKAKGQSDK